MIRHREVSSLEVIDAHLRRIDEVNPRINAVVQMDAERARAGLLEGARLPLAGPRWLREGLRDEALPTGPSARART